MPVFLVVYQCYHKCTVVVSRLHSAIKMVPVRPSC